MWKSKEEIAAAKNVPFQTVLAAMNVPFSKVSNGQLLYYSPFTDENTPSCLVDTKKNIIKDFSADWGGDVIAFVIKKKNLRFQDAVDYLNKLDASTLIDVRKTIKSSDAKLTLTDVKPLTSDNILQYVYSRGIDKELAETYIKQVHYRSAKSNFVSLGFQNDSGGYELRSPPKTLKDKGFKGCLGYKNITTINYEFNSDVAIFEGFFSFLSYLQLRKNNVIFWQDTSYIILNSLVNIKKVPFTSYNRIRLYLDNDSSGIKAANKIIEENNLKTIVNCSFHYSGHKDLNEYLLSKN